MGVEEFDREGRVVTLFYPSITVVGVYVPTSGIGESDLRDSRRQRFDDAFEKHLLSLPKPLLVMGDLNVARYEEDVFDGGRNLERATWGGFKVWERGRFEELLKRTGLLDGWEQMEVEKRGSRYTFFFNQWDQLNNRGWRLDYILGSPDLLAGGGPVRQIGRAHV